MVVNEVLGSLLLAKFFQWICPENVAHEAMSGRFPEAINLTLSAESRLQLRNTHLLQIIQGM